MNQQELRLMALNAALEFAKIEQTYSAENVVKNAKEFLEFMEGDSEHQPRA